MKNLFYKYILSSLHPYPMIWPTADWVLDLVCRFLSDMTFWPTSTHKPGHILTVRESLDGKFDGTLTLNILDTFVMTCLTLIMFLPYHLLDILILTKCRIHLIIQIKVLTINSILWRHITQGTLETLSYVNLS